MHSPAMDKSKVYWPWFHRLVLAGLAASLAFGAFPALADETDNFRLPLDSEMADLGEFLEAVHTLALEEAVSEVNAGIEKALKIKDTESRSQRLAKWHEPDALARVVAGRFGVTAAEARAVQNALGGSWARRTYPGLMTSHPSIWLNFSAHFPLDPRILMMIVQASTVRAYGVYFGTDKLTHFHHLGWSYYKMYRSLLRSGASKEEACRKVIQHHAEGGFLAEGNLYGRLGTGVYSNGDMVANYLGFKFLLNLTEPVTLAGTERQPLVVRCGVFWRLNDQVRPRSGWFRPFISDHWNEALNPCYYDWTMRPGFRRGLRHHAGPIVQFYTRKAGRPMDPAYYDKLARELSTYQGEPYGHYGQLEKLMTIGNTCMPALRERETSAGP
jgi:hypothetical protein